jgi:hypothetical protein
VRLRTETVKTLRRPKRKRRVARITAELPDVKDGVVLSTYLEGFRCWHLADLVRVPAKKIAANVNRDAPFPPATRRT